MEFNHKRQGVTMKLIQRIVVVLIILFIFPATTKASGPQTSNQESYLNKTIGIKVFFPQEWDLYTSRENAHEEIKNYFRKDKQPDESPLFIGMHKNQQVFTRLLFEWYPGSVSDYFDLVYATQKDRIQIISAKYSEQKESIEWIFTAQHGQIKLTFKETLTKVNDNIIRFGLWTFEPLFIKYRKIFEDITENTDFLTKESGKEIWSKRWENLHESLQGKDIEYVLTSIEKAGKKDLNCSGEKKNVLWEVKGQNNSVYLFGSIHFGKPEFYPLDDDIENSFHKSKYLVVEVNALSEEFKAKMPVLMQTRGVLPNNKTIKDVVSKGVYNNLVNTLEDIGLPFNENLKRLKPWLMSITLTALKMQIMGYVPDYGVEKHFLNRAVKEKAILELEGIDAQIDLFEYINGEDMLAYTLFSINTMELKAGKMINAWRCGDLQAIEEIIFKKEYNPAVNFDELHRKLFFERNKKMTDKLKKYLLDNENYFVVVGSGHLVGDRGIVALLKNDKYKVIKR
jgi:uncharacterized protein YbaP (TraB family)